jgi:fructose-specific phosphotransferase system IIA component
MEIFSPDLIKIKYYALDKKSCLQEMVDFIAEKGIVSSSEEFFKLIFERESLMSTGIGRNVAIPHARSEIVRELKISVFVLETGIDYDALDGELVRIIFLISVPESMKQEYMRVLSLLSNFCRESVNRDKIINSTSSFEVYELLKGIGNEI